MSTLVPLTGFGDNYKVYNTGDRVYYENGSNSFSYDKSQADQMAFLVASGQISPNSLQAQAALNLLGGSNPYANKTSSELSTSGYGSNFTLQSPAPRTQESWAKTAAGGAKPDIKTFMDKTGVDFQTASNIIYGNVGSNNDTRNWASIMSSANPVQEAQQGLHDMYGGITTQSVQTGVDSNGKPTYSDMFVAGNGTVLSSINDATYSNGNDGRYSLSYGQSDEYKSAWANGAPVYKPEVAPATTSIGSQSSALTPQQARDMIERSMISGVPTSEFNAAGGYDAVAALAKQAGLGGSPTVGSILKYGNTSGSGNQTYMSGGVHDDIGAGYDGVSGNNYFGEAQRAIMEDKSNAGLTLDQIKWKQQQQQSTSATPSMSNTDFNVNELKTAAIADSNNPIVRQAMARAMQSMNGRGLLNSSMATQAAQEAAIAKALEIAAPDTAAYYQDLRDGKQFGYQSQLNQQGYDHAKDMAGINFGYQSQLNQQGYDNTKDMAGINFGYQSQLNQQGYGNQEYMARLNNDLSIANSQAQYDMKVGDVTQTNYITMIDRIQQDTTKQVQQINSSAMPYEEKQAAIRNIQSQAQAQIDNANRLFKSTNGWQDQWAVAADTYSWQVEGAPEKPEDDNPFNNSGEY